MHVIVGKAIRTKCCFIIISNITMSSIAISSSLSDNESTLLCKMGFDSSNIATTSHKKWSTIQVPTSKFIEIKVETPDFDKIETTVLYKSVPVMSISQKTAHYYPYCYMHIDETKLNEALLIDDSVFEAAEKEKEEKKFKPTEYQTRLMDRISQVDFIVNQGGQQEVMVKLYPNN